MHTTELAAQMLGKTVIDLTQTLEEDLPVWPTHPHFYRNVVDSHDKGDDYYLNMLTIGEHCGTHVDAPAHFVRGGKFIDEVDALQFVGRGVVIDVADQLGPCAPITLAMITAWEAAHGPILAGDIVMFRVGYDKLWALRPHYDAFLKDWPGLSGEGAQYLVERKVKAVGTDSLALDAFGAAGTPAHAALLGNGVTIIENLANLTKIKDFCLFMALPLKIKHGSGSPVRAIAFVD